MDSKEFWRKFRELAEKEAETKRIRDLGFLKDMEFKGVEDINWISFHSLEDLPNDEIEKRFSKARKLIKDYDLDCDLDMNCLLGGVPYNAVFLNKLDKVMPINQLGIVILMRKKKPRKV